MKPESLRYELIKADVERYRAEKGLGVAEEKEV